MTQVTVSRDLSYGFALLGVLMGSARPLSPALVILIVEARHFRAKDTLSGCQTYTHRRRIT
jgi:hypothetical protein